MASIVSRPPKHDLNLLRPEAPAAGPRYGTCTFRHPGHHLEQLTGEVRRSAGSGRRHVDLARIGFRVVDCRNGLRLRRKVRVDCHDVGHAADGGDPCDVADEIEAEVPDRRGVEVMLDEFAGGSMRLAGAHDRLGRKVHTVGLFLTTNGWPSRSDSHCGALRCRRSTRRKPDHDPHGTWPLFPYPEAVASNQRARGHPPSATIDGVKVSCLCLAQSWCVSMQRDRERT